MKVLIVLLLIGAPLLCLSQNVGIGTTTPLALLHVADSNVVFSGSAVTALPAGFTVPVSGAGTRMMWLPRKSAFRAGTVNNEWDTDSIGIFSFAAGRFTAATGESSVALGYRSKARGIYSTAMGFNTVASNLYTTATGANSLASGTYATAMGANTVASGTISMAMGDNATASGPVSFASGLNTVASDYVSTAMGVGTVASNYGTTAMGVFTEAPGYISTAMGQFTRATGTASVTMGSLTNARAYSSLAIGRYNDSVAAATGTSWINTDPLFYVGNGSSDAARHNAMVVYKNGNMILKNPAMVNTNPAGFTVPVSGAGTRMMWLPEKSALRAGTVDAADWDADSIGAWSTGLGFNTLARGDYSVATGIGTKAYGAASTAMGSGSIASGLLSVAIGNNPKAFGTASIALGSLTTASGSHSLATGYFNVAGSYSSFAAGRFNDSIITSSKTTWVGTDPLFYLGNGTADNARSNAFVVYKNGNTGINGYTQLGKSSEGAPSVKQKKITGYNTPTSANPNTFTFIPHGLVASKILSIEVLVTAPGGYLFLPHSTETSFIYTVNSDPIGGGLGESVAVGVKSVLQSSNVMGRPIKILITYEE